MAESLSAEGLEKKRPLTDAEIESLRDSIPRPKNVNEILFRSVVRDVLDSKLEEIRGVEANPVIKEILRQKEKREQERLARIQIKLTADLRQESNFPSIRDQHLPKFYDEVEIPVVLESWRKKIEQEVLDRLGLIPSQEKPSIERSLTPNEIDSILVGISYNDEFRGDLPNVHIDPEIAGASEMAVRNVLRRQLQVIKIKEERIGRLIELIHKRFQQSLVLPGKLVGNIMASSFGEAATQQTLNTFHASGDRNARKQITGFAKFDSILEATENPQTNTMTIFMKGRPTGEQMRLRISEIQATILSDLIESHRVIPMHYPMPRWEYVSDIVRGIRYDFTYGKDKQRLNLHRRNPMYNVILNGENSSSTGRILEIKLDTEELFFRRISLSQIASAIEQISSDYRVVTSNLTIGLIYIYFNIERLARRTDGQEPDFVSADPFRFALENAIYPSLLTLRITGVTGVNSVYVQSYRISTAINFAESSMDMTSKEKRTVIRFNPQKTIMSGIRPGDIADFILSKIRLLMPVYVDPKPLSDPDEFSFSFDAAGLQVLNVEKNVLEPASIKNLEIYLKSDSKLGVLSLLRKPVAESMTVNENINGQQVRLAFDAEALKLYGFDLDELSTQISGYLSDEQGLRVTAASSLTESAIFLSGLGELGIPFVTQKLSTFQLQSDALDELSVRWYYNAEGRNLPAVMAHPGVDTEYTRSDNVVEVYRTLGVETCRSILLEEIASNVDPKINPVHIELLADSLTYRTPGDKPIAQNHYGMTKRGAEWISRMWEMTTTTAMEAGLGQVDNLQSFPARIMMGILNKSSKLAKEDREEIQSDPTFKYDFPELQKELDQRIQAREEAAEKIKSQHGGKLPITKARARKPPAVKAPKSGPRSGGTTVPSILPPRSQLPAFVPEEGEL